MAIFGKDPVEPYKVQIEFLTGQIERLEKQVKVLTEALVAARSPDAYREMKIEEAALSNYRPLPPEEVRKRELQHEAQKKWIEGLESPTFHTFEDFENWLRTRNPPTDQDVESEPLHAHEET